MLFKNLMDLVDPDFTMMIIMTTKEGKDIGYDFAYNKWLEDSKFCPEMLTTVRDYRSMPMHRTYQDCPLVTWSHIHAPTVKAFEGIHGTKNDVVILFRIKEKVPKEKPVITKKPKTGRRYFDGKRRVSIKDKKNYNRSSQGSTTIEKVTGCKTPVSN